MKIVAIIKTGGEWGKGEQYRRSLILGFFHITVFTMATINLHCVCVQTISPLPEKEKVSATFNCES